MFEMTALEADRFGNFSWQPEYECSDGCLQCAISREETHGLPPRSWRDAAFAHRVYGLIETQEYLQVMRCGRPSFDGLVLDALSFVRDHGPTQCQAEAALGLCEMQIAWAKSHIKAECSMCGRPFPGILARWNRHMGFEICKSCFVAIERNSGTARPDTVEGSLECLRRHWSVDS